MPLFSIFLQTLKDVIYNKCYYHKRMHCLIEGTNIKEFLNAHSSAMIHSFYQVQFKHILLFKTNGVDTSFSTYFRLLNLVPSSPYQDPRTFINSLNKIVQFLLHNLLILFFNIFVILNQKVIHFRSISRYHCPVIGYSLCRQ